MMDATEAALDYKSTLKELVANNKSTINLLTILADDYNHCAPAIVQAIDEHLHNVARDQKLPVMYLADSIVKNVPTHYRELFARIIVRLFVHTFQNGDERVRASLYKLRTTWKDIFPRGKLYDLDLKVHAEDPNWPVETPMSRTASVVPKAQSSTSTPSAGGVHVNPRFISNTSTGSDARSHVPSTVNPTRTVTVASSDKMKVEVKPILKKVSAPSSSTLRDPRSKGTSNDKKDDKEKDKEITSVKVKQETIDEPMPAEPTPPMIDVKPDMKSIKIEKKTEIVERKKESSSDKDKDRNRKRASDERRTEKRRESPPPKQGRRSPPRNHQRELNRRPINSIPPKATPSSIPSSSHRGPTTLATPTNVVGSHAFSIPPRPIVQTGAAASPPIRDVHRSNNINVNSPFEGSGSPRLNEPPLNVTPSLSGPLGGLMPPPSMFNMGASSSSHMSGLINSTMSSSCNPFGPNRGPIITSAPSIPSPFMNGPPPPFIPSNRGMPPPQPSQERKIHSFKDSNQLEGLPSNNRIFVDGKAYEVLYIGDTAVIERDGLPHRIYFMGQPRNVVIDGTAYLLGFNESREVFIDNDVHIIRFGAPSRELYMSDFPFKGAFGGPPIIATINGRRHEIRLAGPAPEVKIEPEPCYELSRFLQQARMESNQNQRPTQPPPQPKPERKGQDVTGLLDKLKKSGIIDMLNLIKGNNPSDNRTGRGNSSSPPPIPSEIRDNGGDRASTPHILFEKEPFDMRFLKTRYDSVVNALLAKRSVCERCGLRFDSLTGERYTKHLDWHIRKDLSSSISRETRSRQWYGSVKEWLESKDTAEDEDSGEGVNPLAKINAIAAAKCESDNTKPSVPTSEASSKSCRVCGESFDEYFDEDSDQWKLRDCVQANGQTCHAACAPDASMIEEEPSILSKVKKEEMDVSSSSSIPPIDPRLSKNTVIPRSSPPA